jgi:Xaa-Pro aminopeptidase
MMRGIKAVRPGRQINVIGRVIEAYAKRFGYGVIRDFTGHGIGTAFHSGLVVPHYDAAPNYATVIEPGMTFTIEPMLTLGTHEWEMWDDGWTVVTKDRRRTAQFEHTLLVTEDGAEILTLPCGTSRRGELRVFGQSCGIAMSRSPDAICGGPSSSRPTSRLRRRRGERDGVHRLRAG